ncbi:DUF6291 domain-containing protein [Treponema denticola]|uniref:DUF6291 domain-containing protein n=1 Tax=Treponema denticola TaxID=158 RepID=UPI0020A4EBA0|nr:DUF6291 domain-containing protein [Treponema denticola]UTC93194.1 hypothetical protein E4N84_08830 [Treponema denticola]
MRESFVFHSEYIADLPEEYKAVFAMYTINYALIGEIPPIEEGSLEWALWVKIARRIDQEAEKYEAIKAKRAAAGKKHKGNQHTQEEPKQEEPEEKQQTEKEELPEKTAEKPKAKNFKKPTIEEIQAYCMERKNSVDAQTFFDFYESKGWKIGTAKMKDWRASVRNWERRQRYEGVKQKAVGALWGNESDIPEEIINMI